MEIISINNAYASGGRRLLAWVIDKIVVSIAISVLLGWSFGIPREFYYDVMDYRIFHAGFIGYKILKLLITFLYFAYMESSGYQATLGKIVLGIKVVGNQGQRISFSNALLRNVSKLISGIILGIGYIMIIFDQKKQGLHDKIADTYVVKT